MAEPANSYDEVLYPSHPVAQSHPDRLATVATLLGLQPPPLAGCRVLELGCASGDNLIPMAEGMPQATFVGIDLSARQIARAQTAATALGLTNITLRQMSILDVGPDFGEFDYIIAHGIFSWVPRPVQDHILAVCRQNLAPEGIAYVSYNTLPGWRMRGMIRDMMIYHTTRFAHPAERIGHARALLDFLARSVSGERDPYGLFLKSEVEWLGGLEDGYLYHEHLEDVNEPVYFHQFAERAQVQGLRYLGEADVNMMMPGHFSAEVSTVLHQLATDLVHLEQYMDFLRNRMFRQTLLCHAQQVPSYRLDPEVLTRFHVTSSLRPKKSAGFDLSGPGSEDFETPSGLKVTSSERIVKAALTILAECWPRSVPFVELARWRADGSAVVRRWK